MLLVSQEMCRALFVSGWKGEWVSTRWAWSGRRFMSDASSNHLSRWRGFFRKRTQDSYLYFLRSARGGGFGHWPVEANPRLPPSIHLWPFFLSFSLRSFFFSLSSFACLSIPLALLSLPVQFIRSKEGTNERINDKECKNRRPFSLSLSLSLSLSKSCW